VAHAEREPMVSVRSRRGSSPRDRAQWRATYENTAYDQLPWFDPGPSTGVRLAVESGFLTKGAAVLDVGCGAGSNLLYLAQHGFPCHGVDLSPGAVRAARARVAEAGLRVEVQEGDVLSLPFPESQFDAVVDNGCFHTIPIRRRSTYAREIQRVLRSTGQFVLSWVAREHTGPMGPPHRPSLREVTTLLESRFLFVRTGFRPGQPEEGPATYFAFLARRNASYPPRR